MKKVDLVGANGCARGAPLAFTRRESHSELAKSSIVRLSRRRWAAPQRLRGIYRKGGTVESLASFRVRKKGKERQMVGGRLGLIGAICGPLQKLFIYEIKKYVVGRRGS